MSVPDKDILITRVLDGEAGVEDWGAFRDLAERDPALWRELAEAQRHNAALDAAVRAAIAVADDVEAPAHQQLSVQLSERMRLVGSWGGWAAAAAIVLVWATGMPGVGVTGETGNKAGFGPVEGVRTPADALKLYFDKGQETGQVVGEMPAKILLDSRPNGVGGGFEVLYLRQIIERAVVDDLYRFSSNEMGQPVPVRMEIAPARTGDPG